MDTVLFNQDILRLLRSCSELYSELETYGVDYPINFNVIVNGTRFDTLIGDLPNLRFHTSKMLSLLAPYRFPNTGMYTISTLIICIIAILIPSRYQTLKTGSVIVACVSAFHLMVYGMGRFCY